MAMTDRATLGDKWADEDRHRVWLTPCATCKHRTGPWTCKAFSGGIPQEILVGNHLHKTPYQGDNGIQYEAK